MELWYTQQAVTDILKLAENKAFKAQYKSVKKAIYYLKQNPKHPSLNTHKFHSRKAPNGKDIFEAYAQNNTPGAYRVFFYYGDKKDTLIIFSVIAHP